MRLYALIWSPEGREIARVEAVSARAAIRKAPKPYRKYLGELYTELLRDCRLFAIGPNGDPYSRAWKCHEYKDSFDESTCTYRGDISGMYGRNGLRAYLRRTYPHCVIREER